MNYRINIAQGFACALTIFMLACTSEQKSKAPSLEQRNIDTTSLSSKQQDSSSKTNNIGSESVSESPALENSTSLESLEQQTGLTFEPLEQTPKKQSKGNASFVAVRNNVVIESITSQNDIQELILTMAVDNRIGSEPFKKELESILTSITNQNTASNIEEILQDTLSDNSSFVLGLYKVQLITTRNTVTKALLEHKAIISRQE
jgi:hypothetical protein